LDNSNVKAIDLINNNFDKYDFSNIYLSKNPNILSIILKWEYETIKTHFYTTFGKEIIEWIYNPKNMEKWYKSCWDLD
jgi:hypothetical protein